MLSLSPWAVAMCGGVIGFAVGYTARRGRLCTFGAFEDAFIGRNFRRLKVLAIALAIALFCAQMLIISGAILPAAIRQLPLGLPWFSLAFGGLMFGFGMALVGTCAFGSLVRLGSGDLRSLVTIIVYAVAALAILRGGLASFRIDVIERLNLPIPGGGQADLAALISWLAGFDLRLPVTIACVAALLAWALSKPEIFQTPRLLAAGLVLGLGVSAAWLVTGVLADDMTLIVAPQGLSFVSPVAAAFQAIALQSDAAWNFGIGTVAGTVIGSASASVLHDEFRWEAFDDQHEMKRHILGGALMGFGGVMAAGCTIGQGITAGSVLALSWPISVGAMALGARFGLYYVMEGVTFGGLMSLARRR